MNRFDQAYNSNMLCFDPVFRKKEINPKPMGDPRKGIPAPEDFYDEPGVRGLENGGAAFSVFLPNVQKVSLRIDYVHEEIQLVKGEVRGLLECDSVNVNIQRFRQGLCCRVRQVKDLIEASRKQVAGRQNKHNGDRRENARDRDVNNALEPGGAIHFRSFVLFLIDACDSGHVDDRGIACVFPDLTEIPDQCRNNQNIDLPVCLHLDQYFCKSCGI